MIAPHKTRPAETTGGLVGIATAIAALAGASTAAVAIIGTAAGLLPSAVTLLVANGGVRGVLRALWAGRQAGTTLVEAVVICFVVIAILILLLRV